jgi:hypothetical protein
MFTGVDIIFKLWKIYSHVRCMQSAVAKGSARPL